MKRLVLSTVAAVMFAIPALEAQAAPRVVPQQGGAQANIELVAQRHGVDKRVVVKKKVVTRKVVRKSHWQRGQRYSEWKRHQQMRDWNRYRLHRPGRNQQWIRVGNDYLLVGIVSGLIAGIATAR